MKIPKFRSFLYPREYDIKEDIDSLYDELSQIDKLESLAQHSGWLAAKQVLLAHIESIEDRIHNLAFRPDENKLELQGLSALRLTSLFLLSLPDLKSGDKKDLIEDIQKRLNVIKETTEQATAPATTA